MIRNETQRPDPDIHRPILFYKIGVLGCAPLDFAKELAQDYDAHFLSSDEIRYEMMAKKDSQGQSPGRAQKVNMRTIKNILAERAIPVLKDTEDVVWDAFFNTALSRSFPQEIARRAGALTAALWIDTPYATVRRRVRQWTLEDNFVIPVDRWSVRPEVAAHRMMADIQTPSHEDIDYVFKLDGAQSTSGILDQFDELIDKHGLSERYAFEEPPATS